MKVFIRDIREKDRVTHALLLPFCEGDASRPYRDIDVALHGLIEKCISSGEFVGKQSQVIVLHTIEKIKAERVVLIGLGKREELTTERIRQAGGKAASSLRELGITDASLSTSYLTALRQPPSAFVEGFLLSVYAFKKYKEEKDHRQIATFTVLAKPEKTLRDSISWAEKVVTAVHFARDLINTPSNDMTPSALARIARTLTGGKVSAKILGRKEIEKAGMGAYLAVGKGSHEQPKFITLRYGGAAGAPIVLIGKTITFDSGGISIKPSEGMERMKYDMAGGAVVLAVMKAASQAALPLHLVGILPAAENLPGGGAAKPGDIVMTVLGKTVEIISTDAEGRLALADAIGFAKKMGPRAIIDVATLTGACSVALGNEAIAMMGNDEGLMQRLKAAGEESYERVWQMPLYAEYLDYIKSDFADLKNSGGKTGSLVTSGYFLKEFAGDIPWVHLDIAGMAWLEKERPYCPKGATGVGVRLLSTFLKEMVS